MQSKFRVMPGVSALIARFEKLGLSVDLPKTPGLFSLYRTAARDFSDTPHFVRCWVLRAARSLNKDLQRQVRQIAETYAAFFSALPFPVKSEWQYGQISVPIFTVLRQYRHQMYFTGSGSAAGGTAATTANPINGEQIKEKTYHRALLCPLFFANSPTSAASSTHINTKASTNTSNPMVHPQHGGCASSAHQLYFYNPPHAAHSPMTLITPACDESVGVTDTGLAMAGT